MRIIPAIDISEGKCVRLRQGDYTARTEYADDPLTVARRFEAVGLRNLHVVDLDGAKARRLVNLPVLERLALFTDLEIDFGGGIGSKVDLELAFSAGARQVTVGSLAAQEPETFLAWLDRYGADHLILGADARNGKIAVGGWTTSTALEVDDFVHEFRQKGVEYVVCTDIARDGMLSGPALGLYTRLLEANPGLRLVASGGVSCVKDLEALAALGMDAAIVGKAYYEGHISLEEMVALDQS